MLSSEQVVILNFKQKLFSNRLSFHERCYKSPAEIPRRRWKFSTGSRVSNDSIDDLYAYCIGAFELPDFKESASTIYSGILYSSSVDRCNFHELNLYY